ncbi:regulatory protein YycH of two-component signal transduction system YycFG [Gracilibacillus halotolerans]|uniref:Regulatory protein YycH of two-component signal transduction system YycFG n=1 Tax=Gracilibacillus halotolerans TaxID=74386 RepID=A0A841RGT9_9BACI|nr:two-component system activity regulator YycH [Gracilibacillus halotolerans]MBB6513360.1 regulatory protein YycH of two-component signal transduction system YycFG [Gracilibacillus halotolerans]
MKLELFKTILLLFLVALSVTLTLNIWSYQGNYEYAEEDQAIDAKLNGTKQTKRNVIKPSQILFHEGNETFGYKNKVKETEFYSNLREWSLYNFRMMDEGEEIPTDTAESWVEIVFPTAIPTSVINELFPTDDSLLYDSEFKRIYMILDGTLQQGQVIFASGDPTKMNLRASVQNIAQIQEFLDGTQQTEEFTEYVNVTSLEQSTSVYIPNEPEIVGRKYRYTAINPDTSTIQSIFFTNPSSIVSSPNPEGGQVYSDSQREVTVRGYYMEYTNFLTSENQNEQINTVPNTIEHLLNTSLDYINTHDGWLIDEGIQFYLSELNRLTNSIEYRMVHQNYPVFSYEGLATMELTIQNMTVYQYRRPLMRLTQSYDREPTDLMTGKEVLQAITTGQTNVSENEIQDIQVGYRIQQQPGGQIFDLIPTWFVKTYRGWQGIYSITQQGGE